MMSWTNCVWTSWWRGWAPTYEHNWIRSWSFKANIYIVYFSRNFNCFDCITHANTMCVASVSLMHDLREFYELRWVFSDPKRPTHVICITSHIKKCTSFFGVFRPIWGAWIICFFRKETAKECVPAIKLPLQHCMWKWLRRRCTVEVSWWGWIGVRVSPLETNFCCRPLAGCKPAQRCSRDLDDGE